MIPHRHKYRFESEMTNGHLHRICGYTDNIIGTNNFHFHYFYDISSYCGHTHYYSGFTGLPIKTENGHVHKLEGVLELNSCHEHRFGSFTFEETAYINDKKNAAAFSS